MKKIFFLSIILNLFSLTIKPSDSSGPAEDFALRCIPSGGRVEAELFTGTGIKRTSNVEHLDLKAGDILRIPQKSECPQVPTGPVQVFSGSEEGGG